MKYLIFTLALMILIAGCSSPPEDAPRAEIEDVVAPAEQIVTDGTVDINSDTSTFKFEGFGVGKSHVGSFDDMAGTLTYEDGIIVAVKGTIQVSSVNTGIGGLDTHLQSADFFNVEKNPEIIFTSTSVSDDEITGTLELMGVPKEITFPIAREGGALLGDFILDFEPFGLSYTGVNPEVRIYFYLTQ